MAPPRGRRGSQAQTVTVERVSALAQAAREALAAQDAAALVAALEAHLSAPGAGSAFRATADALRDALFPPRSGLVVRSRGSVRMRTCLQGTGCCVAASLA
jgi:hypothetical protein